MINADNFIFHSDYMPFTITQVVNTSINSGSSIAANATVTLYSQWYDVSGSEIGFQTMFGVDGSTQLDYYEYGLKFAAPNQYAVVGSTYTEYSGGKIRGVLKITNYEASTQTYTPKNFTFDIFIFKVNNV